MARSTRSKDIRLHCNECGRETSQKVLAEYRDSWSDVIDDQFSISGGGTYKVVRCGGCGEISFASQTWFSEECDEHGRPYVEVKRYPPALSRRHPDWFTDMLELPEDVREPLKEIYVALQNGSSRLCALGIRALLEHIMVRQVRDRGTLGKNINAFFTEGYVAPRQQKQFREKVIGVCDAVMHRAYCPKVEEVHTLLDLTEGLIAAVFVHPLRAKKVGNKLPPRARSKKSRQPEALIKK